MFEVMETAWAKLLDCMQKATVWIIANICYYH